MHNTTNTPSPWNYNGWHLNAAYVCAWLHHKSNLLVANSWGSHGGVADIVRLYTSMSGCWERARPTPKTVPARSLRPKRPLLPALIGWLVITQRLTALLIRENADKKFSHKTRLEARGKISTCITQITFANYGQINANFEIHKITLNHSLHWDDAVSLGEWFLPFQRMVVYSSLGSRARRWRHYNSVRITCPETWAHIPEDFSLVCEKLFGKISFPLQVFWNGIWLLRLLSFWILFVVWCFKISQHCRNWIKGREAHVLNWVHEKGWFLICGPEVAEKDT
jgi:hypothetical protein